MAEVIELGKFAGMARGLTGTTPMNLEPSEDGGWSRSSVLYGSQEFLSATAVRKLDNESPLGRVLELIELTMRRLETCIEYLGQKEMFSGDDELMACKRLFSEMLMFRDLNDSIGLIAWTAYKASQVTAITDAPTLPEVLHRVLTRLWASPFMRFDEACLLSDEIETAVLVEPAAGYLEVSEELLTEQPED